MEPGIFLGISNFLLRGIPHNGDMETLKQGEMKTWRNDDIGTWTSTCWNMEHMETLRHGINIGEF